MTTVSNLGTTSTSFRLRVGAASGTDPVVTYTRTVNPVLAIPDGAPRGVFDQLNITDDLEIADLDLRADSVTHTFTGDLTLELRSPAGIGTDFIALIDGLTDGGTGHDLTNMVADDDVTFDPTNDMVEATAADAPYTKSWLPVFNAPWPPLANFPTGPDPVGNLSRYDGTSTKGTWSLLVSDQFAADTGTLNAWSILVTPVHFACTAFSPAAAITATKTVAGTFQVGGTVTYTVTLTNNGTANQADNTGHEFTDTLPAGLTLTNATATSGTATFNSSPNLVTWDGSLAPLGGSVTITITATINAGAQNSTISNQGSVSFDSNNDNVNDSTVPTDDPTVAGTANPTSFTVGGAALSATKTATGNFTTGSTVTYTIVISNSGAAAAADNSGHEFTDVLPATLTLETATATAGTAVPNIATNTVTWDGSVPAGGSVTITITAKINEGNAGATVSNQATVSYDADLNGSNETTIMTDDPNQPGAADPTQFVILPGVAAEVPTVSGLGLALLGLGLLAAGFVVLYRRKAAAQL